MKEKIKLAIVGSRTFADKEIFDKCMSTIMEKYDVIEIISGGAKGADTFGEQYATENNIPKKIYKPDWEKYGKKAGFLRNHTIIKACDVCLALWDGNSNGTRHDINLCKEYDKTCFVYNFITNENNLI